MMTDLSTPSDAKVARLPAAMEFLKPVKNVTTALATPTPFPTVAEPAAKNHFVEMGSSTIRKSVITEQTTGTHPTLAGSTARNQSVVMVLLMLERRATTET